MPGRKIQVNSFPVPELAKYAIAADGTVYKGNEGHESRLKDRLKQISLAEVDQNVGARHWNSTFDQLIPGVWVIRHDQEVFDSWNAAHPEARCDNAWSPRLHAGAAEFLKKHAFGPSREHPHWWGAWGAREEQAAARISESDRVWTVIFGTQSGALWREFVADVFAGQPKAARPTDHAPIVVLGPVAAAFMKS
jgi:hypothetical protein